MSLRRSLQLTDDRTTAIREFAQTYKIPTLAAAMRRLIDLGLEAEKSRLTIGELAAAQKTVTYLQCENLVISRFLVEGRKWEGQKQIDELALAMYRSLAKTK